MGNTIYGEGDMPTGKRPQYRRISQQTYGEELDYVNMFDVAESKTLEEVLIELGCLQWRTPQPYPLPEQDRQHLFNTKRKVYDLSDDEIIQAIRWAQEKECVT